MNKIGVLAEQCLNLLQGGHLTDDIQFTFPQMVVAVGQARDQALRILFWENKRLGEGDIDGAFIKDYPEQEVKLDADKKMYYSDLPSPVVALANDMGVYQVLYEQDQYSGFTRVPNGFLHLTKGLEVATMSGRKTFFKESERIYYPNFKKKNGPCTVLMKLIPSGTGLSAEDYSYMTPEMEMQVVQAVVNMYAPSDAKLNDIVNDNIKR